MVSIDGSLFIQIANFIFLILVLNMVLFKPIRKVLVQRQEKISGLEKDIETADKDADAESVCHLLHWVGTRLTYVIAAHTHRAVTRDILGTVHDCVADQAH